MDDAELDRLVATHPDNGHRVFVAQIDGRRVFVKQVEKDFPNRTAKWISGAVDHLTGRAHLTPLDQETMRIAALKASGFTVPDIVARTDRYLVLSDIGPNLETLVALAGPSERERLLREAAATLRRLHDCGGWHGAAVLRNITQAGSGIGFLDLENRVDAFMPLRVRQVWDLWSLGHAAALFDDTGGFTATALRAYGEGAVRTWLWCFTAVFVGTYVTLKPFQPLKKRELRQTIGCMGGIFAAGRTNSHAMS